MGVARVEIRQPGQDPFVIVVDREVGVMSRDSVGRHAVWARWRPGASPGVSTALPAQRPGHGQQAG